MENKIRISCPEGIVKLIHEIGLKHRLGLEQEKNNIYMVDLPEPTEAEKEEMRRNRAERRPPIYEIDEDALLKLVEKLRGW